MFGVEDGVVQNMTLIVGMIGAALSNRIIVIAAAINAIAGVLSMSKGTYLSSKAERDVAIAARDGSERPSTDPEPRRGQRNWRGTKSRRWHWRCDPPS